MEMSLVSYVRFLCRVTGTIIYIENRKSKIQCELVLNVDYYKG